MGFRIFDLVAIVGTRNPGVNDKEDTENTARLNYAVQAYIKQLIADTDQRIEKGALDNLSFRKQATCFLPYLVFPFISALYKQPTVFSVTSLLIAGYFGHRSQRSYQHNVYTSFLLRNTELLDPRFVRAYEQRDARYLGDLLEMPKKTDKMTSTCNWRYQLF